MLSRSSTWRKIRKRNSAGSPAPWSTWEFRSGTNTLHGAAYAFGRADAFDARNIFNPAPDANGNCLPNPALPAVCNKLPTRLEQFGGVVGGPIKKDKTLSSSPATRACETSSAMPFPLTFPALGSLGGDATHSMVDAVNGVHAAGLTAKQCFAGHVMS